MSNWPDHTPEPGETPRWWAYAIVGALIGAILFLTPGSDDWFASFRLPEMRMPEISLPEVSAPDLRGRSEAESPAPATPSLTERMLTDDPFPAGTQEPIVQPMAFEECVALTADMPNLGQAPLVVEDTPDRHAVRIKFADGDLTVTCSRPDGTMTMQRRG